MLRPPEPDSLVKPAIDALRAGIPTYRQVAPLVHLSMSAHRLTEHDLQVLEDILGETGVQALRRQVYEKVIRVRSA